MGYQSTFSGAPQVGKSPLRDLAATLQNYATPALNAYADYKGEQITEKTDRDALVKARETEAKSYADAVAKGQLDGTQSPYWQSVYDNVKGKNHGIQFSTQKSVAMNDWINSNIAANPEWEDKDGSLFNEWSTKYDVDYFNTTLEKESNFFKKGLNGVVTSTNANLSSSYASFIQERQKTILAKNLENIIVDSLENSIFMEGASYTDEGKTTTTGITNNFIETITTEGANAKLIAGLTGDEFNAIALSAAQSVIEKYAVKGSPDANYDAAFSILNQVKNYKRSNGSNLFNAKTSKEWAKLEQELYSESEAHDNLMQVRRSEILSVEFVKNQKKLLVNNMTGGPLAKYDPQAQEKAGFASDAFDQIMIDYIKETGLDPDDEYDMIRIRSFSNDVQKEIKNYYDIRFGEDVAPFNLGEYKSKKESERIANIPLMFSSYEEAQLQLELFNDPTVKGGVIRDAMKLYGIKDPMTFLMQQELLMRKLGWIKGTATE
jgi:hypothetical protein